MINRPRKKNSITDAMWARLPELVADVDADPQVKVLVIRGSTPDAFCAGADINEYRARAGDAEWSRESRRQVSEALVALKEMVKPSISVIRGACFGGGVAIALASDFRLADTTAFFSVSPARMGMVYLFPGTVELVRTTKRIIRLIEDGLTEESEEAARPAIQALEGEDHLEGVTAFLERRRPRFGFR